MPVLRTKVTRCIAIYIFRIYIGSMLDQGLNNAKISSQARNVEGRTEVVGPGIYLRSKFDEYLDERSMALTWCQMKRGETIRICAINNFEHFVILVEILFREC